MIPRRLKVVSGIRRDEAAAILDGVPAGREIAELMPGEHHEGSCVAVVATVSCAFFTAFTGASGVTIVA